MKIKQKISVMLIVLFISLNIMPVFAMAPDYLRKTGGSQTTVGTPSESVPATSPEADDREDSLEEGDLEEDKPFLLQLEPEKKELTFKAELREAGEKPGLYGRIDNIPENTISMWVEYSFGGKTFYIYENEDRWKVEDIGQDDSLSELLFELDEHPLSAYQKEKVNTLLVRVCLSLWNEEDIYTETVKLTHGKVYPLPENPPPFSAEILYSYGGYQVDGHFTDFPPDVVKIRPMYSLDGENYQEVNALYPNDWWLDKLGTEDERELDNLQNQMCVNYSEEPLASYVKKDLERFYVRLEITTESGVYNTEAAVIERGLARPLPDDMYAGLTVPFTMRPLDEYGNPEKVTYGQYQVTVSTDATTKQIYGLLPDELPVEVQLFDKTTGDMVTSGIILCEAEWKKFPSFNLAAGETVVLPDAVNALTVPYGAELTTPIGVYSLPRTLTFADSVGDTDGTVRLMLNAVAPNEKPEISLQINDWENALDDIDFLSLAFHLKPSGATSVKAYSIVEGDEEWTEIGELVSRRGVDYNQAAPIYGYISLLSPEDYPFADYLNGEIPGFMIAVSVKGGTFDGQKVMLPWPGDYKIIPGIKEPGGSEGNENNAGSGGGNGGSSGGQRPSVSHEEAVNKENVPVPVPEEQEPVGEQQEAVPEQQHPLSGEQGELSPKAEGAKTVLQADGESEAVRSAPILPEKKKENTSAETGNESAGTTSQEIPEPAANVTSESGRSEKKRPAALIGLLGGCALTAGGFAVSGVRRRRKSS